MKRWIIIALTLAWTAVQAQDVVRDSISADTTDTEENVIGARPSGHVKSGNQEPNIIGMPIYYDRNGNAIGSKKRPHNTYHMPKHHYLNNLGRTNCSVFFECKGMFGRESAFGFTGAYVPQRWGVYGSWMRSAYRHYGSVGPVLRISGVDSHVDVQLYGGLLFSRRVGGEVGLRLAAPKRHSSFCWTSGTVGMAIFDGKTYAIVGLSLPLTAVSALALYLL